MVGTINPVVYGKKAFSIAIMTHGLGLALGAGAMGTTLGLLGTPFVGSPLLMPGVVVLAAWAGLAELNVIGMPRPQSRRQVPRSWRYFLTPWQTGFLYGLVLGPGITTRISTFAFYVVLLGTLALASPQGGVLLFLLYAAGRWLSVAIPPIRHSPAAALCNGIRVGPSGLQSATGMAIGLILAFYTGTILARIAAGIG